MTFTAGANLFFYNLEISGKGIQINLGPGWATAGGFVAI